MAVSAQGAYGAARRRLWHARRSGLADGEAAGGARRLAWRRSDRGRGALSDGEGRGADRRRRALAPVKARLAPRAKRACRPGAIRDRRGTIAGEMAVGAVNGALTTLR